MTTKKRKPALPGQTAYKGLKEALDAVRKTMLELHTLVVNNKVRLK